MIPLQVKSYRNCARARLCNAWIIAHCDLKTGVPRRQRVMLSKTADWLEATVESITRRYGVSAEQQEKTKATIKAYSELQREVGTLYTGGKHVRDDVESLKVKFAALLDLCGIQDADIPVFDEPLPVRCNQQSLITSFGIMSKRSPHTTPRRSRRVPCDTSVFGEMVLEHLLSQPISDSDTSPPRPDDTSAPRLDDSVNYAGTVIESQSQNSNNAQMSPLGLHSPRQHSSYPSQPAHHGQTLEPPVFQKGINQINEHRDIAFSPATCNGGRRTPSHCTTDSGVTGSDNSNVAAASRYRLMQQAAEADLSDPQIQNRTSGSTPELPASHSSTCLDILFASMFDSMEYPDSVNLPVEGETAAELVHCQSSRHFQGSPVHHEAQNVSSQSRYTHATKSGVVERRTSQSARVSSACEGNSPVASSHDQLRSQTAIPDKESSCQADFIFCEPLVVSLPPEPTHKSAFNKHVLHVDKYKKNCQPYLVDKSADVEPYSDSERPPLPPRRPMTETKVRTFTVQPSHAHVSNTMVHGVKSYYSEKKLNRFPQQTASDDVSQHSCNHNKQIIHSEKCVSGSKFSPRNSSAHSKHDVPEATMVSLPKINTCHEDENRKPQPRQPQASLTRSGSASKRRRGNDKLPVENSNQDEPVRSARQRLKFISPSRFRDDGTSSDSDSKLAFNSFPVTSHSECATDQAVQPKKVQDLVCRMWKHQKEHNHQSPHRLSTFPRKAVPQQYNIRVGESDVLTSSDNATASAEVTAESSRTSSVVSLPNREEDLMDRNAYYGDFTVDRQITCSPSSKTSVSSSNKDNESQHSLEHLSSCERKVEGSEHSPSKVIFKVPSSDMRAPRTADQCQRSSRSKMSSRVVSTSVKVSPGGCKKAGQSSNSTSARSESSSQDYAGTSTSSSSRSGKATTRSSLSSRSSSRSSRASSHKSRKCTSHPIASSTFIFDSSYSNPVRETQASPERVRESSQERVRVTSQERARVTSQERVRVTSQERVRVTSQERVRIPFPERGTIASLLDSESVITWTINDETTLDHSDKSFNHTHIAERRKKFSKRQSVHIDKGSARQYVNSDSMLTCYSKLTDNATSPPLETTAQPVPVISNLNSTSDRQILAAAPSFLHAVNSNNDSQKCSGAGNQAARPSMKRSNAKALLVCTPSEESDLPGNVDLSHFKHVSASEPDLRYSCSQDEEETDYSLVPSDADYTDLTSDNFQWENQSDIPSASITSSSSSCTAARCRPIHANKKFSEDPSLPEGYSSLPDQDQMDDQADSILTESPKSVNSSGIYAPQNSYVSPATSHREASSSSNSAITNQDIPHHYPIIPPPAPYNKQVIQKNSATRTDPPKENREPTHPFTLMPQVNHTPTRLTRNQGVTAVAPSTPRRPPAVTEASRRQLMPVVPPAVIPAAPPAVIPDPPKIKDKNSLVQKLKRFSSHFTKKSEKLPLGNL